MTAVLPVAALGEPGGGSSARAGALAQVGAVVLPSATVAQWAAASESLVAAARGLLAREVLAARPAASADYLSSLAAAALVPGVLDALLRGGHLPAIVDVSCAALREVRTALDRRAAAAAPPAPGGDAPVPVPALPSALHPAAAPDAPVVVAVCRAAAAGMQLLALAGRQVADLRTPAATAEFAAAAGDALAAYWGACGGTAAAAEAMSAVRSMDAGSQTRALPLALAVVTALDALLAAAPAPAAETLATELVGGDIVDALAMVVSFTHGEGGAAGAAARLRASVPLMATVTAALRLMNSVGRAALGPMCGLVSRPDAAVALRHVVDLAAEAVTGGGSSSVTGGGDHTPLLDALLAEALRLTGVYATATDETRESLAWGTSPTLLQRLCRLPFRYFSHPRCRLALLPTLIIGAVGSAAVLEVIRRELSPTLLTDFVREATASPASAAAVELRARFDESLWPATFTLLA